jgi:hypothetical protein
MRAFSFLTYAAFALDRAMRSDLPSAIRRSKVSWSIWPASTSISGSACLPAAGAAAAAVVASAWAAASASLAAASSRSLAAFSIASATSAGGSAPSSSGGGGTTVSAQARSLSFSCSSGAIEYSLYSNSGDHHNASNGQTSTQMPQYMHSAKSMAKRSSTLRVRARPPSLAGGTVSLCESM